MNTNVCTYRFRIFHPCFQATVKNCTLHIMMASICKAVFTQEEQEIKVFHLKNLTMNERERRKCDVEIANANIVYFFDLMNYQKIQIQ